MQYEWSFHAFHVLVSMRSRLIFIMYCRRVVLGSLCSRQAVMLYKTFALEKFPCFKGTVARVFWPCFFFMEYSIWAPDFEAKRISFSFSFSRS
jgi:hypothetical protein